MSPAPAPCQLCDQVAPLASRNHGLDLCERCSAGYLAGRLAHIGAELLIEEVQTSDKKGNSQLQIHVVATMRDALPLIAKFEPKTLMGRLRGVFERAGFKSGDPLFDSRITVQTRNEPLLRTLLGNDGFQSAVMTLVTACGPFEVKPGHLDVRASLEDLDVRAEVPLAAAAFLRHLANAA